MSAGLAEIWRIVGGLQTAVENLTATWATQDRKASESRKDLYEGFGDLRRDFAKIAGQVDTLAAAVAEMRPAVRAGEAADLRSSGAWKLLKLLGYIIAALIGAFGNNVVEWLHLGPSRHQ